MKQPDAAGRVARRYEERSLQGFVRWKLRSDPAYAEVVKTIRNRTMPLIDVGCGVGLLEFYLREHGFKAPMIGIDFDGRKIERARQVAEAYTEIDFVAGDVRDPLPDGHDVVMLDVLHYLDDASQTRVLENIASVLRPGMMFVMRQGLRDDSWRHRVTRLVDGTARALKWMRGESLNFPTREHILAPFSGFDIDVRPLWGRTPFNNYFFVITRPL